MHVNFKAYTYLNKINFSGNKTSEKTSENELGVLIHETCFFRESRTDNFVKDYVLKNFSNEPKLKIVDGACSTGEEAYTQAMLFNDAAGEIEVCGFDISPKAIQQARKGVFSILRIKNSFDWQSSSAYHDSFLIDDKMLTNQQKEQKELFFKFFKPLKLQIYFHNQQDFQASDEIKSLCRFDVGDIKNLAKMYDENSVHVLMFKNALYHLICGKYSSNHRYTLNSAQETVADIAKQANRVLKQGGLLVFGQQEERQGVDTKMVYQIMVQNGFEPVMVSTKRKKKMKNCNVWRKTTSLE